MRRLSAAIVVLCAALWARPAHAQYRNKVLGFDFSYMQLTKPSVLAKGTNVPALPGARGDRLSWGLRLGGEFNFKLHHDHWWFSTRLNLMSLNFTQPGTLTYDQYAQTAGHDQLGFNLGLEGLVGLRYYWLTDRFRPYLQLGLGYLHIFSFGSGSSAACDLDPNGGLCNGANTMSDALMPRRNIMPFHATPGIEWIVKRDVALHIVLDYSRWIVFRGRGNNVFIFGLGLNFFG